MKLLPYAPNCFGVVGPKHATRQAARKIKAAFSLAVEANRPLIASLETRTA